MHDYEICERGQDGIGFHACLGWTGDRVIYIASYDHEGPNLDGYMASFYSGGKWINVVNGRPA